MNYKKGLDLTSKVLAIVGGINWVTFGAFGLDVVDKMFMWTGTIWIPSTIKVLAGASIVYLIAKHWKK